MMKREEVTASVSAGGVVIRPAGVSSYDLREVSLCGVVVMRSVGLGGDVDGRV